MASGIELHQALHGYRDGHQLLSSSLELTRDQQWQMLVMSDLSGPSFREGFDAYLTGYPLLTGGFYCLARTWFAPELSRPGCVWTHSILISDTDVAQIHDFRPILSNFRRPLSSEDVGSYTSPIHEVPAPCEPYAVDRTIGSALLYLLYGSPAQKLVLISEGSHRYESLLIAILNQQWPRLRRSFRFCTGALAIRDIDFDVAIAPRDVIRQDTDARKAITTTRDSSTFMMERSEEDWVHVAVDDLLNENFYTPLRPFLWKFGPDYNDGRSAFRPLCEIHLAASLSSDSVEQVLSATAHFFPEADSSKRLKAEFFGIGGQFGSMPRGESLVLHTLVTHPAANSISSDVAAIEQRARAIVNSDGESAVKTAVAASNLGGTRAEQYLDGFAAGVTAKPTVLRELSLSLMLDLLKRYPALLTSAELWRGSAERQMAIASAIPSLRDVIHHGKEITAAILAAGAWQSLPTVLAHFRHEAVLAVFEWIDALPQTVISVPDPLFAALGQEGLLMTEIIQRGQIKGRSLIFASALLDPRADKVRALGTKLWAGAAALDIHLASAEAEVRSRTFLLSLGFSLMGEDNVHLVRAGFSPVYEAAREGRLDDEVWRYIEPYLPWYLATWDRCARMIRGTVRQFLDRQWPPSEFVYAFATEEQFRRALEEADCITRGSRYIKKICELARQGSLTATASHLQTLERYCDAPSRSDFY